MGEHHAGEQGHEWQGNGGKPPPEGQQREENPREKPEEKPRTDPHKARRTRIIAIAAVAVAAVAALLWWLHARHFEGTDDAQIDANMTALGARVPGTVLAVHVEDNQPVKQGELLVELDPADLLVSLAQAKAAVALAEAQLRSEEPGVPITETSNQTALKSGADEVDNAAAELEAARRELDQAQAGARLARQQLARARMLLASHTIPQAEFDQKTSAEESATAAVAAAKKRIEQRNARLATAKSRLAETKTNAPRQLSAREAGLSARGAQLELAKAQLHQAELNLGYAKIVAPVAGIAGKRSVNIGDRVEPGQPIVSITQTGDLWVTANFRETQIKLMQPGQPATVHIDALSRDYTGKVESFAGATGSRYSLMPPENASGNYVKVVQRLPVRLRLDPGQPELERLRPGMSAEPKVRVR